MELQVRGREAAMRDRKKHFQAIRAAAGAVSERQRKVRRTYRKYSKRVRLIRRLMKAAKKLL